MANLTDYIEEYLKKLLALSASSHIEIKRRELAGKFSCVPSQINYVLERRFTPERGYLVESRRGGSGFIRIYRLEPGKGLSWQELATVLEQYHFEPARVEALISRLLDERMLSRRDAFILKALIDDDIYEGVDLERSNIGMIQRRIFLAALREMMKTGY